MSFCCLEFVGGGEAGERAEPCFGDDIIDIELGGSSGRCKGFGGVIGVSTGGSKSLFAGLFFESFELAADGSDLSLIIFFFGISQLLFEKFDAGIESLPELFLLLGALTFALEIGAIG